MEVWITKYALTEGIYKLQAIDIGDNMVRAANNALEMYHKEGREWHRTKESAIARAEEMRIKKIVSLEKQIDKIKKLNFEEMCE